MVRVVTANDAPPAPVVQTPNPGVTSFTLTWTATTIADKHATEPYEVLKNGAHLAWTTGTSYVFGSLVENQTVTAGVKVKDSKGLLSAETKVTVVTDNAAPPAPTSVVGSAPSHTQLTLDWAGVTGITDFSTYEVLREGGSVTSTTATAYTWSGLAASTNYDISVRTKDTRGAVSAWVTKAVTTKPNPDTTPPGDCNVTSFKPEDSHGRLVVRFTCPTASDFNSYQMWRRVDLGAWDAVTGWVAASPGASRAEVLGNWGNTRTRVDMSIWVKDDLGNVNNAAANRYTTYIIEETPHTVDPTTGGTYRGGAWRNDSTCAPHQVFHGRTSSGENYGCFFYGTKINDFCGYLGRTITSMTIEYYRVNDQGSSAEIQPLFWTHKLTSRSGTPGFSDGDAIQGNRLGPGVGRTIGGGSPPADATAAYYNVNGKLIDNFVGAAQGFGIYRSTSETNPDNAASYYMKLGDPDTNGGGPTARVCGRVQIHHWG